MSPDEVETIKQAFIKLGYLRAFIFQVMKPEEQTKEATEVDMLIHALTNIYQKRR